MLDKPRLRSDACAIGSMGWAIDKATLDSVRQSLRWADNNALQLAIHQT